VSGFADENNLNKPWRLEELWGFLKKLRSYLDTTLIDRPNQLPMVFERTEIFVGSEGIRLIGKLARDFNRTDTLGRYFCVEISWGYVAEREIDDDPELSAVVTSQAISDALAVGRAPLGISITGPIGGPTEHWLAK
jgi:hypothetical protein